MLKNIHCAYKVFVVSILFFFIRIHVYSTFISWKCSCLGNISRGKGYIAQYFEEHAYDPLADQANVF